MPNVITLTPNSRLARYLWRAFEYEVVNHQQTVDSKTILPLNQWLHQLYQQQGWRLPTFHKLLSQQQEQRLWQQVVAESSFGKTLLQIETTATLAQQAYKTLLDWQQSPEVLIQQNIDSDALYQWIQDFESLCQQDNLISAAKLPAVLLENLQLMQPALPEEIILYAFDEVTPLHQTLFTELRQQNITITEQNAPESKGAQGQICCDDLNHEINTMTHWAKARYQEDPQQKILCVVPNLTQIRPQLVETFKQIFFPEQAFNPELQQQIYNISGGYSLLQAPIVQTAFTCLSLRHHRIKLEQVTSLLTTPYIQSAHTEISARALLDVALRDAGYVSFTDKTLLANSEAAPLFHMQLTAFFNIDIKGKQPLAAWQNTFTILLQAIGWPGERNLNSEEYQQSKRLLELIDELATIDTQSQQYSYQQALQQLQKLCQNTLFEIESHDGPVQVLGVLEAAGTTNDHCWVMHLDDITWPQLPQPNPFIPYDLQRQLNMPHSSAERELDFAQRLLNSLCQSNTHCYFSYHQFDGDKQLQPSPLITSYSTLNIEQLNIQLTENIAATTQNYIEQLNDTTAPPLPPEIMVKGGSGIFKSQAACPFQAFAKYRLAANGIVQPEEGLDPRERGSLLHACLDKIWRELKTHQQLVTIAEERLASLVEILIEQTFTEFAQATQQPVFFELEATRLQQLLLTWLKYEKQRPAFQVVAHEQWRRIQVGQIQVNVQLDRIDQLASGEKIIIDYKTGKPKIIDWFGDRPKEPQLPLYCMSAVDIDGIAFAQVRIDDMAYKGICATDIEVKGIYNINQQSRYDIPEDWQLLIDEWQTTLLQLADNFQQGHAEVDPVAYDTCQYCDLHSLCRVAEQGAE